MKKTLYVTVDGPPSSGKSTVLGIIMDALRESKYVARVQRTGEHKLTLTIYRRAKP